MTTTKRPRRIWPAFLQLLAIGLMMFIGLFVAYLGILTAPENFTDRSLQEPSDLGLMRMAFALFILLLIPWYRKIPLLLIIVGTFYAVVIQGDPYVLAIGLTVWIVRAQRRWEWIVAAGGLAAMLVNILWHILGVLRYEEADTPVAILTVVTLGFTAIGFVLAISLLTRQRRSIDVAHAEVQAVEHDRDEISSAMTRQTEREHLAREVHDTLAQRLTALSLQTGQMQRKLDDADNAALTTALEETKHYSDQALRDLRSLVTSLREQGEREATVPSVAPSGFQDLTALLDDAAHQGLTIHPRVLVNSYDAAPDETQRAVLRITQEALTNVMRHSIDNTLQLRIEGQPGSGILLEFINRYAPHQVFDSGSKTGLQGIKERAELVGGTAEESYSGEYFQLTVQLPWPLDEPVQS